MPDTALQTPFVDLSRNTRIPILMGLVVSISQSEDAAEVMRVFVDTMRVAYGSRGFVSLDVERLDSGQYRVTRYLAHEGEADPGAPTAEPGASGPICRGGFLARVIAEPSPKLVTDLDVASDAVLGDRL